MLPRLHLVTDDQVLAAPDFAVRAEAVVCALGASVALHLRSRTASSRALYDLAVRLGALPHAVILINDRVDVALAAHAAGVQLPQGGLPVAAARSLLRGQRWIGYSVHNEAESLSSQAQGADYLLAGTIFASASHPDFPPQGTELLRVLRTAVRRPIVAIGGIDASRVSQCCEAGAYGVAVIRAVWQAAEPVAAARQLLDRLELSILNS